MIPDLISDFSLSCPSLGLGLIFCTGSGLSTRQHCSALSSVACFGRPFFLSLYSRSDTGSYHNIAGPTSHRLCSLDLGVPKRSVVLVCKISNRCFLLIQSCIFRQGPEVRMSPNQRIRLELPTKLLGCSSFLVVEYPVVAL